MIRHARMFAACIGLGTAAAMSAAAAGAQTLPAAAITMVDQRGDVFSLNSLDAPYLAITFVAARCSDTCPISNAMFANVQQHVVREHVPLDLVTITLDPRHDSPRVMNGLAQTFHSNPRVWRLASGEPASVEALMRDFGISVHPDKNGVPEGHDTFVYILNAQRKLEKVLVLSNSLPTDIIDTVNLARKAGR